MVVSVINRSLIVLLTPEYIYVILLPAQVVIYGRACPKSAILIEEEVVPKMDSSTKRSAVASLLALR